MRYILYLLISIFLYSIVRAVVQVVLKGMGDMMKPPAQPPAQAQVPLTGELKRDPVCGTYIATTSSVQLNAGGATLYFCSTDCRDKYVAAR